VGVIKIDSGWISAAVGTAAAGAALMWPEYGHPLGLALLIIAALIFVLGVRIEGFHIRIGRKRRMASSPKGARDEAIKKPTTEQIEARRLLEWKDVPEAIEAFAESSLLKARDKWKEQFEEANENGHDAEDQIRIIRKKFANGHVPNDTAEAGALATARRRLEAGARSHDLAKDELRLAWNELRGDIHKKLSGGELIAEGFRAPHVAGSAEIEISSAGWRILFLDTAKSEAIKKDGGESVYTGLMICKCPPA